MKRITYSLITSCFLLLICAGGKAEVIFSISADGFDKNNQPPHIEKKDQNPKTLIRKTNVNTTGCGNADNSNTKAPKSDSKKAKNCQKPEHKITK